MSSKKINSGFAPLASSTFSGSRLRLDLDSTRVSSSDSSGRKNTKHLDYAYNEYLQAIAKKRIISSSIRQYETLLQQQIDYQNTEITKIRKECEKKKIILHDSLRNNEMINVLHGLEERMKEFEKLSECQNISNLISLSNILGAVSRELKLLGVKTLSHKEEWLSLVKIMNECCKFLKNFFHSHKSIREFELIDEISIKFKGTLELQTNILEQIVVSSTLNKTYSIEYLDKMKNLFDVIGVATL